MANRRYIDFPIASTVGDSDIILIWQSGANKQTTKATFLSGLPENLDELNDVAISGLTNGQILRYDSVTGKWENTDQGNLDLNDLNDVSIVSPSNGQVLVYNSSTSQWENSSGGFVPYVGAVTTVDLGAQGLRAGYVRFDTSVVSVPDEQGLMYWDGSKSTVALIMNGTLQHIGQDTFFYCKNSTGSSIPKGTSVRFAGTDGASGHILITPFLANGSVPSNYFIGVTAEVIGNGSFGQVMHFGELDGINTSGYTAGALLYASTTVAGAFQTTVPVAPNNIVLVAAAVNSKNNGAIVVRPTYGSNINTDEGVKIVSVADKNLLQYQSGTSLWENKSLAQVLGGTSAQFVKGDGSLDSTSYGTGTVTSVGLSSATSGVTIGSTPVTTSGTITLAIATASGSQNGLLSSTDWTTFNSKQNALTNPVTGTGTTNYLPKFTGSTTIGNSNLINDASGNLGLGVTPSAWGSSVRALQFENGASIASNQSSQVSFNNNVFAVPGTNDFYIANGFASRYIQFQGQHSWSTAASGTAGNAITFSTPMTLTAAGRLLINTPTESTFHLDVNGTGRFSSTVTATQFIASGGNNTTVFNSTSATTGWVQIGMNNTSGSALLGVENSSGGTLATGTSAYSTVLRNYTNTDLQIATNNIVRTTITSGGNVLVGNATASGSGLLSIAVGNSVGGAVKVHDTDGGGTIEMQASGGLTYLFATTNHPLLIGTNNTTWITITTGGEVLIGNNDNGAYNLQCNGTGVWGAGAYVNGSDRNIKDNISTIEKGLEYIEKMNPVRFKYKPNYTRDHKMQTGFIAQELQEVFANEDYLGGLVQNGVHLSVAYQNLLPILVKAIQELNDKIK